MLSSEMGAAAVPEVKNEVLKNDYQQDEEPNSNSGFEEDQMTIHQYLISKSNTSGCSSSISQSGKIPKNPGESSSGRMNIHMDNINNEVPCCPVMARAKEVQANLDAQFPSFIKLMLRSHVTKGFWLGLPAKFCKMHLPSNDGKKVTLEDESGAEYETNFLGYKGGLGGGWAGFAMAHNLLEGDAAVFHLVRPCKFKVYIVRSASSGKVDGAIGLLTLENHTSGRPSGSFIDLQNFDIIVNGFNLGSRLSEPNRIKYYKLCHSQKSYLHNHLLKSINARLAAGIILKTVQIAETIKACEISTPLEDFAVWDKTLEGFELLGMEVGFLRARLNKLILFAIESEESPSAKRYMEANLEYNIAEEEIIALETKLVELQQVRTRLETEIQTLNMEKQNNQLRFREEANAPW